MTTVNSIVIDGVTRTIAAIRYGAQTRTATWAGGTSPAPTTHALLTETGDILTTEGGNVLVLA